MIAIQEPMQPVNDHVTVRPACPNCGRPMHLTRTAPSADGFADRRVFKCGECAVRLTELADERRDA